MAVQLTIMSLDFESFGRPKIQAVEKGEITFGRDESNDIVFSTPEVSQSHAKLRVRRETISGNIKLFITDLGSTNGTEAEYKRVAAGHEVEIPINSRIRIGNHLIKPTVRQIA